MNLKDLFYLNRSDRSVLLFFLVLAVAAIAAATPSPASAAPRSAGLVRPALKGFVARKSR